MRSLAAPLTKLLVFAVVTVLLTAVLAATIAASNSGAKNEYTARFADASGLDEGDEVRMSGVRVGQVSGLEVAPDSSAVVEFDLTSERRLPADAQAIVKYRNLAGQRYLALDAQLEPNERKLPHGAEIPAENTHPALNLTELFNGFQPLFQALEPQQVNQLSGEIIQVLQGEGSTVESLLQHTASLTSTIARKDEVIGQVIDNLEQVIGTVNEQGPQLGQLIDSMQQLTSGFAGQREPIGQAVESMGELSHVTSGLLEQARPPLKRDIEQLDRVSGLLNSEEPELEHQLRTVPHRLNELTRTVSYGSWFNYYLCRMSGNIGISELNVNVPLLPIAEMPERCYPE